MAVSTITNFYGHSECRQPELFLFKQPLFDPAKAAVEQKLMGSFVVRSSGFVECLGFGESESIQSWHIGSAGKQANGMMELVVIDAPVEGTHRMTITRQICFAKKIGEHYYAQIPCLHDGTLSDRAKWARGDFDGYLIVRIRINDGDLNCDFLNFEQINKLVSAGKFELANTKNPEVAVVAGAKQLQTMLLRDEMFLRDDSEVLERINPATGN